MNENCAKDGNLPPAVSSLYLGCSINLSFDERRIAMVVFPVVFYVSKKKIVFSLEASFLRMCRRYNKYY